MLFSSHPPSSGFSILRPCLRSRGNTLLKIPETLYPAMSGRHKLAEDGASSSSGASEDGSVNVVVVQDSTRLV